MKYIIVVLLSALVATFLAQTAPALTKSTVHNVSIVTPTAKPATTIKTAQTQPEKKKALVTDAGIKRKKKLATSIKPKPSVKPVTHVELMAAAGIPSKDYGAADYIITHESNWNPEATEPTSGAHGLPQALPYSKTGCGWSDPLCQLRWANKYAVARYGGWWQAQAYWSIHRNW